MRHHHHGFEQPNPKSHVNQGYNDTHHFMLNLYDLITIITIIAPKESLITLVMGKLMDRFRKATSASHGK